MGARIFTDHQIHKAVQNKMDKVRFCTRNYSIVLKIQIQIIFSSVDTVLIFSFPPFWSPSFPPFITYHFADWGCGWLPICNSYHFKAFFCCLLLKAVPTGRNLQQATIIFSLHSPTFCLPFHCLPAASSASPQSVPSSFFFRSLPHLPILFSCWATACCESLCNIPHYTHSNHNGVLYQLQSNETKFTEQLLAVIHVVVYCLHIFHSSVA